MSYDPAVHHRRSIRLKQHDYAGGGVYFVTVCAHRELVAATGGKPFTGPLRALMEERMRMTAAKCPQMSWGAWVIMPDHFHAIIRMRKGPLRLGDVIGGFKAAVAREWHRATHGATQVSPVRRGEACLAPCPAPAPRIWHRNYYEMIVRSAEAEQRIAEYIRMNPWRCVQELGGGLRGIGNPALWGCEKLGVLCSRAAQGARQASLEEGARQASLGEGARQASLGEGARQASLGEGARQASPVPEAEVYLGGWHSPMEREILAWLLQHGRRVIACPAWGIKDAAFAPGVREALEQNRMLILEMRDVSGNLAAAEARNRFVIAHADALFTPYVARGGMLERLLNESSHSTRSYLTT